MKSNLNELVITVKPVAFDASQSGFLISLTPGQFDAQAQHFLRFESEVGNAPCDEMEQERMYANDICVLSLIIVRESIVQELSEQIGRICTVQRTDTLTGRGGKQVPSTLDFAECSSCC